MTHKYLSLLCASGFLACNALAADGTNLLKNGDFEAATTSGWGFFLPADSKDLKCVIGTVEGGAQKGNFSGAIDCPQPARVALAQNVAVTPGTRYRITAWAKAAPGAALQAPLPGAYLRVVFLTAEQKDCAADLSQIGLSGKVTGRGTDAKLLGTGELPQQWTKFELVVEAPADAASMAVNLFSQGVTGRMLWDSATVEAVPATTPLTTSSSK